MSGVISSVHVPPISHFAIVIWFLLQPPGPCVSRTGASPVLVRLPPLMWEHDLTYLFKFPFGFMTDFLI